jgi:aminoglycoside phosphotransferase family enzyme/predicted kinase
VNGEAEAAYALMRETHSSVVFFVGDRVHKMKKPLDLGFLDNRTRTARKWICHREVELNRRLAPDVYLGVADMHDPDGEVCEHFVVMKRLPDDRRMAALIERGVDIGVAVEDVARQVAALHAASPHGPAIDRCATAEFVTGLWQLSLDHLDRLRIGREAGPALDRIRTAAERYVQGRTALFDERIAAGRAVDGHGDMLCDDIFCLDDGPRIIDCLEFDDELRYGDASLDLAFLAMDFERLGALHEVRTLLEKYTEHSSDHPPASLVHHYIAYRALVRAKVTALRHEQGDAPSREDALSFLAQAERNLGRGRVRLVLVGGVAATGKSTLSRVIGNHLRATVLRSDVVRKELAGMAPTDRAGDGVDVGLYSADSTDATYRELRRRATELLGRGESVVLDATWLSEQRRGAAREVAASTNTDLIEIECTADQAVLVQRIESRITRGDDASDATPAVLDEQLRRRDEWPGAVVFDTTEGASPDTGWLEGELGLGPW